MRRDGAIRPYDRMGSSGPTGGNVHDFGCGGMGHPALLAVKFPAEE